MYFVCSRTPQEYVYLAKKKDGSAYCLVWHRREVQTVLYEAGRIGSFALAEDEKHISLIAEPAAGVEDRGGETARLVLIDKENDHYTIYPDGGFDISSTPVWLSRNMLIVRHVQKGIVSYNLDESKIEDIILPGDYHQPVLWNHEFLIARKHGTYEVYIHHIRKKTGRLLFKNHFATGHLLLSPDNRYLVCQARYMGEKWMRRDGFVPLYDHLPGLSLFVLRLEDNVYTYYGIDPEAKERMLLYPEYFTWCSVNDNPE